MDRTSQGWLRPIEISSEVVLPGHVFSAGLTASGHTWWLVIGDAFVKTSLPETMIRDWTGTAWTAERRMDRYLATRLARAGDHRIVKKSADASVAHRIGRNAWCWNDDAT
jgi:hypothetical protein